MENQEKLIVDEKIPLRLDLFLKQRYPDFSRTYFQNLIEEGIEEGNFRPVNAAVTMKALIAMMGPVVFTTRPAGTPEQMLDDALELFFKGIEA